MRGVIMHGPGDVRVEDRDDPVIVDPTDAVIRLAATCICGSDLWPYRGADKVDHATMGHEYVGVVEEVGSAVTTAKPGDFVGSLSSPTRTHDPRRRRAAVTTPMPHLRSRSRGHAGRHRSRVGGEQEERAEQDEVDQALQPGGPAGHDGQGGDGDGDRQQDDLVRAEAEGEGAG